MLLLVHRRNGNLEGTNGSRATIETNVSIRRFGGAHKKRPSVVTTQRTGDGFAAGLDAVGYLAALKQSQH